MALDPELVPEKTKAARPTKLVRPEFEPKELGENKVLRGQPPAPPLTHAQGGLNENERAIADRKMKHPDETCPEIGHMLGLSNSAVQRALDRPHVKLYMSNFLDAAGADLKASAKVVADAHQATKVSRTTYKGEVCATHDDIDHVTRLEAAKLNMQAHGVLDEAKNSSVNVYYNLTESQLRAIEEGRQRLEDFISEPEP